MGIFDKFKSGLGKSSSDLTDGFKNIFSKKKIDDSILEEFEELIISSDAGVDVAKELRKDFENFKIDKKLDDHREILKLIADKMAIELLKYEKDLTLMGNANSSVIVISGVNGVGKTTTIGKLANKYKKLGLSVVIGAADTFRAAAIDQLVTWANRVDVPIVKQNMGSDPASVAFDTLNYAKNKNADIVLIDTAGRLHNKVNLMNELSKIKRVMDKVIDNAPHDVMLVLDGSTGQNAFIQAKEFTNATEVTSLAITKLDGTAKGGVVIGISDEFKIPVKYIGVGEALEDLQEFNKLEFIDSFFD